MRKAANLHCTSRLTASRIILLGEAPNDSTGVMQPSSHTSKSILLIDGKGADRQYYTERLKHSCPELLIYQAASGRKGLELYYAKVIDCVILELRLPDMSGFEVLTTLIPVARVPEVPVIILTVVSNLPLLQVAKLNGAQAILQKLTASGDQLVTAVEKGLARVQRDHNKR